MVVGTAEGRPDGPSDSGLRVGVARVVELPATTGLPVAVERPGGLVVLPEAAGVVGRAAALGVTDGRPVDRGVAEGVAAPVG